MHGRSVLVQKTYKPGQPAWGMIAKVSTFRQGVDTLSPDSSPFPPLGGGLGAGPLGARPLIPSSVGVGEGSAGLDSATDLFICQRAQNQRRQF
ncbi:MAG: hypothetical protein UY20_C0004G0009 [Candidatus Yanofskybacteria bacterium GW2011_GWA1_48_10]|uniref:Uncharacterized protein n=1 Tax=Candidatus Yanofskybacteria bacterium GW2011_GWA1_48_10 TaxID=1619022 RepID=A0A0G1U6W0_9BACT|nr:MAG: hypothetical protein UW69_C0031G0010 [Microgenomates group bacterium GW2011_GWA2_44_7]KKU89827.1 MAG: hypothetical protein UY20_C0004G0009 [Candidatus Yanofskybacteria bacterium GW2011_GWA1_48_10]